MELIQVKVLILSEKLYKLKRKFKLKSQYPGSVVPLAMFVGQPDWIEMDWPRPNWLHHFSRVSSSLSQTFVELMFLLIHVRILSTFLRDLQMIPLRSGFVIPADVEIQKSLIQPIWND